VKTALAAAGDVTSTGGNGNCTWYKVGPSTAFPAELYAADKWVVKLCYKPTTLTTGYVYNTTCTDLGAQGLTSSNNSSGSNMAATAYGGTRIACVMTF
jgi:hypothetical protein